MCMPQHYTSGLADILTLPLFIRNPDYQEREMSVEKARRRRLIRTNSLCSMFLGGSLLAGSVGAILLSFFVANGGAIPAIISVLVGFFGYRLVTIGASEYMAAMQIYEEA